MTSIVAQKRLLRTEAAKRRDLAAVCDIGERLVAIFEENFQPPRNVVVSGYYPIGSEANVLPLLERLKSSEFDVALPVVVGRGKPLLFRLWTGDEEMRKGPYGILEPGPDAAAVRPDMILAPLLAFDRSGNRLGYGGGYYDLSIKSIREHQPVLAVGVAYAAQEVAAVPHDENDTVLDKILTENGVIAPESGNL